MDPQHVKAPDAQRRSETRGRDEAVRRPAYNLLCTYVDRSDNRLYVLRSWECTMGTAFYTLALLACPVGMGLMMWMMMRGQNNEDDATGQAGHSSDRREVDALRAQIEALKAEHAAQALHDRRP